MSTNASEISVTSLIDTLAADAVKGVQRGDSAMDVLSRLIEALPVAALVVGDDGGYLLSNALASELTGYSADELRRLSVWELTPDVHDHEIDTLWRAFRQQRAQSGDYQLLRKDGRVISAKYAARVSVLPGLHVSLLHVQS